MLACEMGSIVRDRLLDLARPALGPRGVVRVGLLPVGRSAHLTGTPMRILEDRFAREIDAEELERRRATLKGSG